MNISFSILDTEADSIAAHHGYDDQAGKTVDEFVLEVFKQFGRDAVTSQASLQIRLDAEVDAKNVSDAAKSSLSF